MKLNTTSNSLYKKISKKPYSKSTNKSFKENLNVVNNKTVFSKISGISSKKGTTSLNHDKDSTKSLTTSERFQYEKQLSYDESLGILDIQSEEIEQVELADLLPYYPELSEPDFQKIISSKNEMIKYSSKIGEPRPNRGEYYNHQNFVFTHAKQFENLVIIDEPGSGKSCQVFQFTEYARNQAILFKEGKESNWKNSHYKGCIVICKNEAQLKQLQSQLICDCTKKGTWDIPKYEFEKKERQEKLIISDISKFYQFKTQDSLWKDLMRRFSYNSNDPNSELIPERVENIFSDYIFWIDEAHNINPSIELSNSTKDKVKQLESIYQRLWELFHYAKRIKIFLTTGTPMINEPYEIIKIMNLILPIENQIPKNIYLGSNSKLEDLEQYFRGRVSFIRSSISNAEIKYIINDYDQLTESQIGTKHYKLYCCEMSDFQKETFEKALKLNYSSFAATYSQISNFVYPDGSWGNKDVTEQQKIEQKKYTEDIFNKKIGNDVNLNIELEENLESITDEDVGKVGNLGESHYIISELGDTFRATPEFKKYLSIPENIKKSGIKFYNALQIIKNKINENFFVYCKYVNGGSGIRTFALCLETLGFERFTEINSIFFNKNKDIGRHKTFCHEKKIQESILQEGEVKGIQKTLASIKSHSEGAKWRYAILDGNTSDAQLATILETMNSYENRTGEYIKVIIASPKIKEAINLKNITNGILLGPEWNHSTIFQIISRFLRATGFEHIIADMLQKNPNLKLEDINIVANIYMMAAYFKKNKTEKLKNYNLSDELKIIDSGKDSIIISKDISMYKVAENKNIEISKIMRIMKQCAIGCHLHTERNKRITDKDYSPECDYDICDYPCSTEKPEKIDYSSYDIIYAQNEIDDCISQISKIFQTNNCFSFFNLRKRLSFREPIIIYALEKMITQKIKIFDRYGYLAFICEDNGYFFLSRNFIQEKNNYLCMSYYSNGLIGIKQNSIEILKQSSENSIYNKYKSLIDSMKSDKDKITYFDKQQKLYSSNIKSLILEDCIMELIKGNNSIYIDHILDSFKEYIFEEIEQAEELAENIEKGKNKKVKQGRKIKKDAKRKIKKLKDAYDESLQEIEGEPIILHTLKTVSDTQTQYSAAAKYSKAEGIIRIIKPSEENPKWRNLHENEFKVYNKIIQRNINRRMKEHDKLGIYGIEQGTLFKIKNVENQDAKSKKDARFENRGKSCHNWNKNDLVDLLYHLNYDIFSHFPEFINFEIPSKEIMIDAILDNNPILKYQDVIDWDPYKIEYHYKFIQVVFKNIGLFSVKNICNIIREYFEETGRMVKL
mgnify:CR=1 FL=1